MFLTCSKPCNQLNTVRILFITRLQSNTEEFRYISYKSWKNSWSFISSCFMQFLNKFYLKNTMWYLTIYKYTGQFKVGHIHSIQYGIWLKVLWRSWTNFFNDFNYFTHVGSVLNVELKVAAASPYTNTNVF